MKTDPVCGMEVKGETQYQMDHSGETYHFVDKQPVELDDLILTIKSFLELKRPREIYVPYPAIRSGKYFLERLARFLNRFGVTVNLPPELMFLENFYHSQTLNIDKLLASSFVDPFPKETIYTALPRIVIYYLTRWGHLNLITTFNEEFFGSNELEKDFRYNPKGLLNSIHADSTEPFYDLLETNSSEPLSLEG